MTQEQKDWYEYGRIHTGYFACKSMGEPKNPAFIQAVWDARKKAHRWNKKGVCHQCAEFTPYSEDAPQEDGRCAIGCGTWCTHTRADDSCNCFIWRKEQP